jgi:regulator of RNase E activity RraB
MSIRPRIFLAGLATLVLILIFGWILMNMGFFNTFFGKKQNTTVPPAISHQEDWAPYLTTVDGDKVGSILVDLGLKPIAPIASKPMRLRVDVIMKSPGENGLPMQSEFATLNEIEDKVSDSLKHGVKAVRAGHLYFSGTMYLYYYLGNGDPFEAKLVDSMSSFSNYKYEYKLDEERDWGSYVELLYPLPIQIQSIHNQKVINHLLSNGDKLNIKRPVEHFIFFKTETDLERFLSEIKGNGFEIVRREPVEVDGYKWSVLLRRDDPVDPESVDDYVLYLWQKAHEANGDYDGWGSTIVRE